jgi:hypothetical protein
MSTSTLNLQDSKLVSVLHTAPANGAPSSADYVDGDLEKVTDLATITAFINGTLLPMLNSLASSASSGLLGTGIYTDTSAQDALVFNAATGNPLTIADSLRSLNGMIQAAQTQVTNLSQQVASLQARLSSSNQNDVALALQGITSQLAAQQAQITELANAVSATTRSLPRRATYFPRARGGPAAAPPGPAWPARVYRDRSAPASCASRLRADRDMALCRSIYMSGSGGIDG